MATKPLETPKYYARLIVDYMKKQPDFAVDDPLKVRDALGMSNNEFQMGVDWCVQHKVLVLEKPLNFDAPKAPNYEAVAMQETASKLSSMLKQPVEA
jgi:hypothetical protein